MTTDNGVPRLSVIMPNYNHARYLHESLGAILSQSYPSFEVIVIDDASTDESLSVLRAIAAEDSRVRLICNEQNKGPMLTVQRGLETCRGEYICFASADDRWHPGFLEKSMALLSQHPDAGLCLGELDSIDGQQYRFYLSDRPSYFSTSGLMELCLRIGNFPFIGPGNVYRHDAVIAAGGLRHDLGGISDTFLVMLIVIRHGLCYLPESVMSMRRLHKSYGMRLFAWQEQKKIGKALQALLYSEDYKDVLDWSRKTGIWLPLQPYVILMLLRNPGEWRFISMRVLSLALWDTGKTILTPYMPLSFKRTIARFRDKYWKVSRTSILRRNSESP